MRAGVISMGSISSKWTVEALKKHFDEADLLDIKAVSYTHLTLPTIYSV